MNDLPTTLIGLLGLAAALIISDWVKQRSRNQRDDTKIGELSKQTALLCEVRDGLEFDRGKNRKVYKRVKQIAKQVNDLHTKTIGPEKPKS